MVGSTGKRLEADKNGIYFKKKEYLFAENDMYMQVNTHYYSAVPVTERCVRIIGKDGKKRKVNCSFLGGKDAGRLAKIIEDGMRKKYSTAYNGFDRSDAAVKYFTVPTAELTEKIDKRIRLLTRIMFWFLTVLFAWIIISMAIQDQLADYGLGLIGYMALNVLILGGVNFAITRKFKKSARNIPCEIVFSGGTMYVDGKSFGGTEVTRVVMTQERGAGTGDMRTLVISEASGKTTEYSFGFRYDQAGYPEYGQLVEAVKENFGDKFAYDIE